MENRTYLVTEAEKLTGEKAHVLRYWEDELGMEIHRNSLGHRCYTAQDIQIFLGIRELKKKGLHLKAIRELMPKLVQATAEIKAFPAEAAETAKEKPDPAIPGKADTGRERLLLAAIDQTFRSAEYPKAVFTQSATPAVRATDDY